MKIQNAVLASAVLSSSLLLVPAVSANAATPTTKAAQTMQVKFAKGQYGATYSGKVTGYAVNDYQFYAKKGQKLKVTVDGDVEAYLNSSKLTNSVYLDEYSADLNDDGTYTLPATGSYQIRIGQTRNAARQGGTESYSMRMTIK